MTNEDIWEEKRKLEMDEGEYLLELLSYDIYNAKRAIQSDAKDEAYAALSLAEERIRMYYTRKIKKEVK